MRKNYFGRQFKRDANERKALFKGLLNALVLEERIRTTEAKAKAIKGDADKLVTKAKKHKAAAYISLSRLVNHEAAKKLISNLGPRFADRNGGYTRITRVGKRIVDNASMVVLEWTTQETEQKEAVETKEKITKGAKKEPAQTEKEEKKPQTKKAETKKIAKKQVK